MPDTYNVHVSSEMENRLREAVDVANVPTLLMVLVQLTGDMRWLDEPYRPTRARGLDDNDSGGLPEAIQKEVRIAAADAIIEWKKGKPVALGDPSSELLTRMISISTGETVPDNYGEVIAAELIPSIPTPNSRKFSGTVPKGFKAIIIGGGVSGICAAIQLQSYGIDFEIIEKNDGFGGTWKENQYPASGVDTPNHLYSFSFAPHNWSKYFALQGEILEYIEGVANDYNLADRTSFNTTVHEARYDESTCKWTVVTHGADGQKDTSIGDIVLSAVGILSIPLIPDIPGLGTFKGTVCHSAEWPKGLDVTGKKVAVVGNGASAMQIVPAIADSVESLCVFARSKQWAAPFPQFRKPVPDAIRFLLKEVPLYQAWYRQRLAWAFNDKLHSVLQKDDSWPEKDRSINATNDRHRSMFIEYMKAELGDCQDLLSDVLPDFPPYGKRILLDNGWFRTVAKPHVTLVPERLIEVKDSVLTAADGRQFEADVLILATGFKAAEIMSSYDVIGVNGQHLKDFWDTDNPKAYKGTVVPDFPNLFTLLGPNTGLGHGGSIIPVAERQMNYVLRLLEMRFENNAKSVEVRRDVFDTYNQKLDDAHDKMIWTHPGSTNWYQNKRGRVVAITPWRNDDFWRMTREVDKREFVIK